MIGLGSSVGLATHNLLLSIQSHLKPAWLYRIVAPDYDKLWLARPTLDPNPSYSPHSRPNVGSALQ